jgi:hypothetical protein
MDDEFALDIIVLQNEEVHIGFRKNIRINLKNPWGGSSVQHSPDVRWRLKLSLLENNNFIDECYSNGFTIVTNQRDLSDKIQKERIENSKFIFKRSLFE